MTELHDLSALEAAAAIRAGEVGPVELVEHCLDRIARLDDGIGAFVTVTAETARGEARAAEAALLDPVTRANLPSLHGVPTGIKDLNLTAGVRTALGSATLRDWVPDIDDFVVTRMRSAGLISLGKTATPEFGLPCYTETDIGPPTRTPWDTTCSAGGSSGGAAAAVAAGFLPIAQGSDGGGSIRIPASVCGLVGLKPSRGRISRGPLDGDAAGLGVLGPLTRTVRDAAAFLDALGGPMPGDANWAPPLPAGESFLAACDREPGPLRIGRYLDSPMEAGTEVEVDAEVRAAWETTARQLEALGHEVVDVRAPMPPEAVADFETVWAVGAASAVVDPAREDDLRPLTRHLRERGRSVTGVRYVQALGALIRHARAGVAATAHLDAVLTPTVARLPRPIGWFTASGDPALDFERQKAFTPWTAMYNMTGQPAVSLPLHVSATGLPIGMMLVGRPAGEADLLMLAAQLERALPWRERHPPVWRR